MGDETSPPGKWGTCEYMAEVWGMQLQSPSGDTVAVLYDENDEETKAMIKKLNAHDELVRALELAAERLSRRIASEGHSDQCGNCNADKEVVLGARSLLTRIKKGERP